jgi:hypothetical protein
LHALCSGRELKRPTLDSQVAFLQEGAPREHALADAEAPLLRVRRAIEDGFGWRALLGCDEAGEDVEVVVFCPDALAASSTRWGERALFAPALLVARRALTGFVPPSTRIFAANSFGSTHRGDRTAHAAVTNGSSSSGTNTPPCPLRRAARHVPAGSSTRARGCPMPMRRACRFPRFRARR